MRRDTANRAEILSDLRERLEKIEGVKSRPRSTLPFGLDELDANLPGGGLAYGSIHEIAGGGSDVVTGAVSALFVAGIAARTVGPIVWCLTRADLFVPSLVQVGLSPDRVIFVESDNEDGIAESFEEALRWRGLAVVVAEMVRLPMTQSRRFQLAAEGANNLGLVIRRWRRQPEATDFGNPSASATRWRVSPLPSTPLPVEGVGRSRWFVELMRARGAEARDWTLEACDKRGRLGSISTAEDYNTNVGISRSDK